MLFRSAYLSPDYVVSKSRGAPSSSTPAGTPVPAHIHSSRNVAHSQAHTHGQRHAVAASSPLASSSSRQPSTDGQPRRRETTREREQKERGREAAYGLPTPPDSDEASGEGIPAPARVSAQKSSRSGSSNVSAVAVVGNSPQRRGRSAQGQAQATAARSRPRTESGPRLASAPSETSQASTVPPTPPAKSMPLKRESVAARSTTSDPVKQDTQKMLRRQSKHLPQLGHNRNASASSPALVSSPGDAHVVTKKRLKWKFWKKEVEA